MIWRRNLLIFAIFRWSFVIYQGIIKTICRYIKIFQKLSVTLKNKIQFITIFRLLYEGRIALSSAKGNGILSWILYVWGLERTNRIILVFIIWFFYQFWKYFYVIFLMLLVLSDRLQYWLLNIKALPTSTLLMRRMRFLFIIIRNIWNIIIIIIIAILGVFLLLLNIMLLVLERIEEILLRFSF